MYIVLIGGHGHRRQGGGVNAPIGVILLNKSQEFFRGVIKPFLQGGTPPDPPVPTYDVYVLMHHLKYL